jgi:hypothetical protein
VIIADQCCWPIVPITMYRLSKASLAPKITCLDFQSACASTKSIPCFALLLSLFRGSNSNTTLSILSGRQNLHQQIADTRADFLSSWFPDWHAFHSHSRRRARRARPTSPRPILKLARCPRSLAPTLVTLPSMSLIPSAPLQAGHTANIFQR